MATVEAPGWVDVQRWSEQAQRARAAHERHLELRAQDADELQKRDKAIRDAIDGGASQRELARAVGVSRQMIYNVLGTEPEP